MIRGSSLEWLKRCSEWPMFIAKMLVDLRNNLLSRFDCLLFTQANERVALRLLPALFILRPFLLLGSSRTYSLNDLFHTLFDARVQIFLRVLRRN